MLAPAMLVVLAGCCQRGWIRLLLPGLGKGAQLAALAGCHLLPVGSVHGEKAQGPSLLLARGAQRLSAVVE